MSIPNTRPRERRPIHPGEILREDFLPEYRLSVTALAEAAGVSRQSINELHRGRVDRLQSSKRPTRNIGRDPLRFAGAEERFCRWISKRVDHLEL